MQLREGFVGEINSFINENKSDFEYVAHNDATDVVYDVIEEHYNETGRILDIKEAVEAVESYLEEEAEKLLNLGKVKNRLTSMRDEYEQPQRQSQTTLSNAHSAQANERVARKLSDEESKSAMAKMLQWDE
jgi:predicted ribosome quality control (RQC) complex YloA/Tae2 family protein